MTARPPGAPAAPLGAVRAHPLSGPADTVLVMTHTPRPQVRATGYGRAALEALRAVVTEAKRADPLAPVTILAPNSVAGIAARRHLASGVAGRPGVAGLHVTTVDRLAEQIAAPLLRAARPATAPIVAAAWRAALAAEPGSFAPVAAHPATIRALVRADAALRDLDGWSGNGRPAPDHHRPLDRIAAADQLRADLVTLHHRVRSALRQRFYDGTDLLLAAAAALADGPEAAVRAETWGTVVLYLPQDLTLARTRFARALAGRTPLVVLAGLTGVKRADAAVRRSLVRLGLAVPDDPPAPPTAQRVRHASDSDDEVRGTVRDVVAALRHRPAHRIAVLYSAAIPYARLLHEHLTDAGIVVNGPGTVPVAERAIARGLLGLLGLAGTDLPRAELFRVLADAPVRAARDGGERIPLARWERTSRLAGIVAGADWTVRLDAYLAGRQASIVAEQRREDPYPGRIDAAQRQIAAAAGLRDFVLGLRAALDEGCRLSDWPSLARWASGLLHDTYRGEGDYGDLPAEEQYAAAVLEQVLAGLAGLAEFEQSADVQGLREALRIALAAALPRVGRFGDGVFVAPLSAAVGLDADEVFLVGLAEDVYPGRMQPDPLLPDEVRALAQGALPATRDALDARHRHLLAGLCGGAVVTASFPRGDLRRSTTRLPSRWLLPTLRELVGDTDLAATDWDRAATPAIDGAASHAAELMRSDRLATEQDWRTRAVAAGRRVLDPALQAALAMITGRARDAFTRFDGNLAGAAGLPDFAGGSRRVSPTALESYAECPHAYFVRRLLRVEPLEQPEQAIAISPLDVGNLIHRSMDELVRRCGADAPGFGRPWSAAQRGLLAEIADGLAAEYEQAGATGHPRLWERERRRILGDLQAMLDDDDAWRAGLDAAVVASELSFGMDGVDPVAVPLPGGGRVLMVGSADKVDRTRDGTLLVTDIKTGSARRYAGISRADPVVAGTRLQLPVYAHAARALLGSATRGGGPRPVGADAATDRGGPAIGDGPADRGGPVNRGGPAIGDGPADRGGPAIGDGPAVRALYWLVRKDRGKRIELTLDDQVESRYAAALHTLVTSIARGLFPAKAPQADDFAWVQCPYCNPDGIGHADVRERWERKRSDPALADLIALIDPQAAGPHGQDGAGDAAGGRAPDGPAPALRAGRASPGPAP